ncbi:hypothetical protein B0H19DRAFT_1083335 [Mycena capillaripes]|nr:hypothetical protein B0H19DRAFT_1083335 [Mycena capillaripes]
MGVRMINKHLEPQTSRDVVDCRVDPCKTKVTGRLDVLDLEPWRVELKRWEGCKEYATRLKVNLRLEAKGNHQRLSVDWSAKGHLNDGWRVWIGQEEPVSANVFAVVKRGTWSAFGRGSIGQDLDEWQEVTFRVALSDDVHQMKPTVQTLSLDINPRDETQSILNLKIEAHLSEMLAAGYDFNLRNLEESWRAVFTELLRIVLPKHVTLPEEATLWTYHNTTRNPGAAEAPLDRTLLLAKGSGYSVRPDFHVIVLRNGRMHVPVLGENKRAISRREMAPSGLDRDAFDKANRQSAVFMIAAVGPIPGRTRGPKGHPQTANPTLPNAMFAESDTLQRDEYTKINSKLLRADAWSKPCMLDTPESNAVSTMLRRWEYLQVDYQSSLFSGSRN